MTPEQHERIIAIQEELFTISESLTTGKDATALRKASEWLSDVTEPLTETEADDWPSKCDGYLYDRLTDLDCTMNDNDRRCALEYLNEYETAQEE